LGKLVPAAPIAFPGNGYIAINSVSTYRMANFAQTDNTPSSRNVGGANIVSLVRRASSYTTTTITINGLPNGNNSFYVTSVSTTIESDKSNSVSNISYTSYTTNGTTQNPSGRDPGNASNPLRPSTVGVGGAGYIHYPRQNNTDGGSGYAVFEFNIVGSYFNTGSLWQPIRDVFLYHNNQWNVVKNTFMNVNGVWRAVTNSSNNVPQFVSQPSNFGVSYREYSP
jgi:hypothetical protein